MKEYLWSDKLPWLLDWLYGNKELLVSHLIKGDQVTFSYSIDYKDIKVI